MLTLPFFFLLDIMIPVPKLKPKSKRNSFLPRASQISEGADYRVPLISVSEIVGFCEQMDLALTEEDLVAPTRARIQLILEALVEILLPWRCDVMEQKLENALNSFDNIVNVALDLNECAIIHFLYI